MTIFVPADEGGGIFHAPVPCRPLADGTYEILPDDFFDFEDGAQLFGFGPGDVVSSKSKRLGIGFTHEVCLVAHQLMKSGSAANDFKRLLFVILEEKPEPSSVLIEHGKAAVRRLLTEGQKKEFLYPAIRAYIRRHQNVLEEAL